LITGASYGYSGKYDGLMVFDIISMGILKVIDAK
jgi:hypothetical protein